MELSERAFACRDTYLLLLREASLGGCGVILLKQTIYFYANVTASGRCEEKDTCSRSSLFFPNPRNHHISADEAQYLTAPTDELLARAGLNLDGCGRSLKLKATTAQRISLGQCLARMRTHPSE